jgi:hypothetical protein
MKATLLDEEGVELTEITSHVGQGSGQMLVDWATRPDVLFKYYFDRGRRVVGVEADAKRYTAILGTRWQMGARFWFLHTFQSTTTRRDRPVRLIDDSPIAPSTEPGTVASRDTLVGAPSPRRGSAAVNEG